MGKVAKVLGVGVKGALEVLLARDVFDAGDVVEGFVVLRVTKPVQCQELALSVEGTERVVWWERHGESSSRHYRTNDFLRDKIVLSTQDTYGPGEYTFGFSYQLQESLAASSAISGRSAGLMRQLSATTAYALKASLPVTTGFSADLEVSHPIAVFAQAFAQPVRPTLIHNQSTVDMASIDVKLHEYLSVTVPNRNNRQGSTCVCQTRMSGIRAGERQDLVLSLPMVTKKESLPINASNSTGTFVQWEYKLVIKCKFTMATNVEVEIPVAVLPNARPRDEDVAHAVAIPAIELEGAPSVFKQVS